MADLVLSGFWAPVADDWANEIVLFTGLGAWFCIGSGLDDLTPAVEGFAAGIAVSSVLAVAQTFGWTGIEQSAVPGGLFYNRMFLGEAAALAVIGAIACRWLPGMLISIPAMGLSESRAAFVALGVAGAVLIWRLSRPLAGIAVAFGVLMAVFITYADARKPGSIHDREGNWTQAAAGFTWLGHGAGSFWSVNPLYQPPTNDPANPAWMTRSPHPHNDAIELIFEDGIGAALAAAVVVIALLQPLEPASYVLIAFLVLGIFGDPLFMPATAFLGALCAGRLCRARASLFDAELARSMDFHGLLD
jgi:O-antigen ligase